MTMDPKHLMTVSLAKIQECRSQRGGLQLHRSLLVSYVLRNAKHAYLSDRYRRFYDHRASTIPGGSVPAQDPSSVEPMDCSEVTRVSEFGQSPQPVVDDPASRTPSQYGSSQPVRWDSFTDATTQPSPRKRCVQTLSEVHGDPETECSPPKKARLGAVSRTVDEQCSLPATDIAPAIVKHPERQMSAQDNRINVLPVL
uniref:Immediate early response gene 5-like protein n=1 Tax=Eptatretus burgeri TaxID=7764 RepID=A0A8C4QPV1_EPTBU